MNCSRIKERLGAYLDGELPAGETQAVRDHLAACPRCPNELEALTGLSERLERAAVADSHVRAPAEIWRAIERRLNHTPDSPCGPAGFGPRWFERFFRRPMAVAAGLAFFLGVGLLFTAVLDRAAPVAYASTIDYRILMDGVASNAKECIDRFLSHYRAEPIERSDTYAQAPHLSFDLPEQLPAGYTFVQAYRFPLAGANAIAATYEAGGQPLFLIFHSAGDNISGPQGTACRIGDLRASQMEAGPWTLVHVADETTCHCVLSTLDDEELTAVAWAVSPLLEAGV